MFLSVLVGFKIHLKKSQSDVINLVCLRANPGFTVPRGWFNMWGVKHGAMLSKKRRCISHSWDGFCTIGKSYLYPKSRGAFIIRASGSPSKFSFLWRALFLVHTHKQNQGCRHWISRLCHRVAPGSGQLSCAASAYISMWKAKAVPNIPSKHLSCPEVPHGKIPGGGMSRGFQLPITFCYDRPVNTMRKLMI